MTHIIAFDEFWWKGESIGPDNANAVFESKTEKGMMPGSVDEALRYKNSTRRQAAGTYGKSKRILVFR
ncbi:MAG: hypothetical protein IKH57_11635 [Clostridia bacterium]|nr:hypothetical protein [Clostridia bacterium]